MTRIITMCSAGLVRSVALADVLKVHCDDVDVIPIGIDANSESTKNMLYQWADKIILMMDVWADRIPAQFKHKVMVCEVGPDTYGVSKNPELIDKVWRWARDNAAAIGITSHRL